MDDISLDFNMTNNPLFNFSQSKTDIEKNARLNITNEEGLNRFKLEDNTLHIKDKNFDPIVKNIYYNPNEKDRDDLCSIKFRDNITNDGCLNKKINSKEISVSVSNIIHDSCSIQCENFVENSVNSLFDINTIHNLKHPQSTFSESFRTCRENMKTNEKLNSNHSATPFKYYDEAFSNLIKEYLNIENFPSERKQKALLLKKFSSIYKKIKLDKTKMKNFVGKLADRMNEGIDDITALLDFEILRNKREASFTNFWKIFKKFVKILKEKNISNICDIYTLREIKNEFVEQINKRINEYLVSYENIIKYLKDSEENSSIIERFQINFKLVKFIHEEGKEKILKKIKEAFDKNHIFYVDSVIDEIFLKTQKEKICISQNKSIINSNQNIHTSKIYNNQNLILIHTNQFCYISNKKTNIIDDKTNEKVSLSEIVNVIYNLSSEKNLDDREYQFQILKNGLNIRTQNGFGDGTLIPVMNNKYFLKNYDCDDFHHN